MSKRVFSEIIDLTEDPPEPAPTAQKTESSNESSVQDPQEPPPGYYFCPICWEHCKEEEAAATCANGHRWCQPCVDGRPNVEAFPCPLCRDVSYWAPPVVAPIGVAAIIHETAVIQTLHEQIFGPDESDESDDEDDTRYDDILDPVELPSHRDRARQVAREYLTRAFNLPWLTPYRFASNEVFSALQEVYEIKGWKATNYRFSPNGVTVWTPDWLLHDCNWTFVFDRVVDQEFSIQVQLHP